MDLEGIDRDAIYGMNSSRHHYIPQFLLKGFTNDQGLFYVYDKQKDKILSKPMSTKAVFFEKDRNTIELEPGKYSALIEEVLFKKIDNDLGRIVKHFQNMNLDTEELKDEEMGQFLLFLITLFWRLPRTDYAFNDLIDRARIMSEGIDSEIIRNDPTMRKMQRAGLFMHQIEEMIRDGLKGRRMVQIFQMKQEVFMIGDFPMLYRRTPRLFSEFDEIDYLIAISSKRIYSSATERFENFSVDQSIIYNAAVIDQSVNYVASCNLPLLEQSVKLSKQLKAAGLLYNSIERLFKK